MRKLKQWGKNKNFPETVETWNINEEIPQWLSDRANVVGFDKNGKLLINIQRDSQGKYHIKDTARPNIDLLVVPSQDHTVLFGSGRLFVLGPKEIDFLYVEE